MVQKRDVKRRKQIEGPINPQNQAKKVTQPAGQRRPLESETERKQKKTNPGDE